MSLGFVVAIPSYDRPQQLRKKTLSMLAENRIPPHAITVFVANNTQRELYASEIGDAYKIVVGRKGMVNIRNAITMHYPPHTRILNVDDDVTYIGKGEASGERMTRTKNLVQLAKEGFALCKHHGYILWGLHPSTNRRSLKSAQTVSTDLKYIAGALFGIINDKALRVTLDHAEDYERCIKVFSKYGGMIRFNRYTAMTTYYAKGGLESTGRTVTKEESDKKELARRYPALATTYVRPGGRTEVRLLKAP